MGYSKSSSNTDIHSDKGLPLEEEKSQINNLTYHLRKLQKKKKSKAQSQQKEGNNNQRGNREKNRKDQ